jgi:uncharacterized protein (TIGR03118 family)
VQKVPFDAERRLRVRHIPGFTYRVSFAMSVRGETIPLGQGVSDMREHFRMLGASLLWFSVFTVLSVPGAAQKDNRYTVTNLVSDGKIPALHVDANLVNGWGIARSPTSPWWVANQGTGTATLYDGAGTPLPLVVDVPGSPTGIVFNGGMGFVVMSGSASGPAVFIFATLNGTISGWNPTVPAMGSTEAFVAFASVDGAVYTGLAIATTPAGDRLYAADFANGKVDVLDASFIPVVVPGAFVDPGIPPQFSPFGIHNLEGQIFVTYAQPSPQGPALAGDGLGYVSKFDTMGTFIARVASQGPLNAPWGLAIAPQGFGRFSGDLLVGNEGNGRINAFDLETFDARGHLKTANNHPLEIDELWGIGFGNDANAGPSTTLFFAAGPEEETQGLFGAITFDG